MQAAAERRRRPRASPRPTRASTAGSSSSPTTATLVKVWRSLEPFSRTYITLVVPGADPQWSADLHAPILAALQAARRRRASSTALERHFAEVSENMARRWPDDGPPTRRPGHLKPKDP